MAEKFQNKYRIPSARLQNWDYGWNASYFVTICTQNRECFFGNIINGEMKLSEIGKMAEKYWMEIPVHFRFVQLGAFIVMPNHIHGIIIINKTENDGNGNVETPDSGVSTTRKWKPATLGVMINQFKRMVTIQSRKINSDFAWQSRFHDHIIRYEKSCQNIQTYIQNNPSKWLQDKFSIPKK